MLRSMWCGRLYPTPTCVRDMNKVRNQKKLLFYSILTFIPSFLLSYYIYVLCLRCCFFSSSLCPPLCVSARFVGPTLRDGASLTAGEAGEAGEAGAAAEVTGGAGDEAEIVVAPVPAVVATGGAGTDAGAGAGAGAPFACRSSLSSVPSSPSRLLSSLPGTIPSLTSVAEADTAVLGASPGTEPGTGAGGRAEGRVA